MKIKRFEAPDTRTALAMVKREMGADAVILSNKTLGRPGRNSSGAGVEVLAAMDDDLKALAGRTIRPMPPRDESRSDTADYPFLEPLPKGRYKERRRAGTFSREDASRVSLHHKRAAEESFQSEAQDLRMQFNSLLQEQADPFQRAEAHSGPAAGHAGQHPRPRPAPETIARWRDRLIAQIRIKPLSVDNPKAGPTIVALVGATGVGKTTTAAKLAAWFSLRERKKVTLLSTDCYRIGATDQLRTYARIMRLPCDVALRKKDLGMSVAKHRSQDLIIIDTAGKNPYDLRHIAELREWFAPFPAIKPYLVISATAKKEDLGNMLKTYSPLPLAGLIATKLDETRAYATLCQQMVAAALPVSCLCVGQRVPEDFHMASKSFLAKLFRQGWASVAQELGYGIRQEVCPK